MLCRIYRCSSCDGMYIYVRGDSAIDRLPAGLLKRVGKLEMVMELELHAERRLARADVEKVMEALRTQEFYLQMPPTRHLAGRDD